MFSTGAEDYISLTDIARFRNPEEPKDVVKNWLRNRSTLEFPGLWEQINNPSFKGVEFDSFFIGQGLGQSDRLQQLNQIAIKQLQTLLKHKTRKNVKKIKKG